MIKYRVRIYQYNNYYNRLVKKESEIVDYNPYLCYQDDIPGIFDIDFKPNDGVSTEQIITWSGNLPDYVIVSDNETEEILSRWFVIEATRIRGSQYKLTLKRDVVVDYYNIIQQSPIFVEKGIVPDDDPAIYNPENMDFNQIKTKETVIKDSSKMAWIVGFVAEGEQSVDKTITFQSDVIADKTIDGIENWQYYQYVNKPLTTAYSDYTSFNFTVISQRKGANLNLKNLSTFSLGSFKEDYEKNRYTIPIGNLDNFQNFVYSRAEEIANAYNQYWQLYVSTGANPISSSTLQSLSDLNNKIIYDSSTKKNYKIHLNFNDTTVQNNKITEDKAGQYLYTYFNNIFNSFSGKLNNNYNPIYGIVSSVKNYTLTLEEVSYGTFTVEIKGDANRINNKDGPFDIFCIPYSDDMKIKLNSTSNEIQLNKQFAMSAASGIGLGLGTNCYDIQLLPFCPFGGFSVNDKTLTLNIASSDSARYTVIKDSSNNVKSYIIWSAASSGHLTANPETDLYSFYNEGNKKIGSCCDMFRLCSPNYNSTFEFNFKKDNLETTHTTPVYNPVNDFEVDFTYLPYSSYIRVAPQFGGLYGKDFGDFRGLILQGDFSIMYTSSAWVNYQTNNKNYLNIFNRQIENMEITNKYNNISQGISSGLSALSTGLTAGALTGNPLVGLGVGVGSAIAGAADLGIQKQLQAESIDYTKDNFGYQLGNIKAVPNSIAKTTAYTRNNKIFPVLEYYTCTDIEKKALANKIKYNGMTIGRIGNMIDFKNTWSYKDIKVDHPYFKGQIIRLEGLSDDFHLASDISNEIYKGVYL